MTPQQSFDDFYDQTAAAVASLIAFHVSHAGDQEDVFQETWWDMYRQWPHLEAENPRAYVLQIARRKSTALRRRRPLPLPLVEDAGTAHDPTQQDVRLMLQEALASLSLEQREAFLMKHDLGLSYQEMAHILDIPMGTVASRLHGALKRLRQTLKRNGLRKTRGDPS